MNRQKIADCSTEYSLKEKEVDTPVSQAFIPTYQRCDRRIPAEVDKIISTDAGEKTPLFLTGHCDCEKNTSHRPSTNLQSWTRWANFYAKWLRA